MKTLILLRHGKSDWSEPGTPDRDRPLNPRGRLASALMGAWLVEEALLPDLALVSGARRTRETWQGVSALLPAMPETEFQDALYLAEPETMRAAIRRCGAARTVLLIAHNPGLQAATARFSDGGSSPEMPTCAAAVLNFAIRDWAEADFGMARLAAFVTPKSLV